MEPQGALVLPDEAGTFTVTSSTQSLDAVQKAMAETLGIPWHKVTAGMNSFACWTVLLVPALSSMHLLCHVACATTDVTRDAPKYNKIQLAKPCLYTLV